MLDLKVSGMTCGHCVAAVTRAVQSVDAAATVQVDLPNGRVRIGTARSSAEIARALDAAGYPAEQAGAPARKAGCCCSG